MKIKKILIGVLAAVLATSAAACGGGNTTTEDRNHIEMYVMDAGYRTEVFDELAKAFKVHFPDVTIKIHPVDGRRFETYERTRQKERRGRYLVRGRTEYHSSRRKKSDLPHYGFNRSYGHDRARRR